MAPVWEPGTRGVDDALPASRSDLLERFSLVALRTIQLGSIRTLLSSSSGRLRIASLGGTFVTAMPPLSGRIERRQAAIPRDGSPNASQL